MLPHTLSPHWEQWKKDADTRTVWTVTSKVSSCRLFIPVIHIEISYKTPIASFFWKVMKSVEIEKASVFGRKPEREQVQVKKTEQIVT